MIQIKKCLYHGISVWMYRLNCFDVISTKLKPFLKLERENKTGEQQECEFNNLSVVCVGLVRRKISLNSRLGAFLTMELVMQSEIRFDIFVMFVGLPC
jgi:hypothetical protein